MTRGLHTFLVCFALVATSQAQSILRTGTNIVLDSGTVLSFPDQTSFELEAGTSFENNGTIELVGSASLNEALNAPIFGSGLEISSSFQNGPLSNFEPGGLGLSFDQAGIVDSLVLTRGHIALLDTGSNQGVGRWFELITDQWPNTGGVRFYVDPTELNGLMESALVLHQRQNSVIWGSVPGILDQNNQLFGYPIDSTGTFTLFSTPLIANIPQQQNSQIRTWPNPTEAFVLVSGLQTIDNMRVIDALGRTVHVPISMTDPNTVRLNMQSCERGQYILFNGLGDLVRIVKQ